MTTDRIELEADGARAGVSLAGAELLDWSVDGRRVLWTPDGVQWDATAPVLFPVCGWTRNGQARVGNQTYPLGLHGFARFQRFHVQEQGPGHVALVLRENRETRRLYPFDFELCMRYRLSGAHLEVSGTVRNCGDGPMPYAFGLHPGFRWPLAGDDKSGHRIRFDAPEDPRVPVIAPGGLFSAERRAIPIKGRDLALDEALFEREALCFLDAASNGLDFEAPGARLRVETEGFRHVVLWSRPGAPFLCVESWTGYGDPEGFDGDLFDKPSMIVLAPGEERRHAARYGLQL